MRELIKPKLGRSQLYVRFLLFFIRKDVRNFLFEKKLFKIFKTVHTLSAKVLEREKELASLKLRLGTTGVQKSENFEIRSRSPTRENPDDDSLISKARTRWADLGKKNLLD